METKTNHDLALWGGITLVFCVVATIAARSMLLACLTVAAAVLTGVALWLERSDQRRIQARIRDVDAYLERMPHE